MKKLLCLLLICSAVSSCKKYEEGPALSLRTKKARMANNWKVDKFLVNGVDKTSDYRLLVIRESLEFFRSGQFQYSEVSNWSWAVPYYTGKWELEDKKEHLSLTSDDASVDYREFKILKLKNDELWLQRTAKADSVVEFHYIPQ